ncbi:hypothetical protein [Pelistega ratti]|uniref:hypothetical protein n=1 Tax=Pelistega ratti TaxID=2652177 RepID=UPI00135CBC8A|nr:hypothetical protein [Pelistega ratti]
MLLFSKPLPIILLLALVGCSSIPKIPEQDIPAEILTTSNGATIKIEYTHKEDPSQYYKSDETKQARIARLRIIDKGHDARADVNDVTATILCNPLSLFSLLGVCSPKIYTHEKEDLFGDITPIQNIALTYAYPKYKEKLIKHLRLPKVADYTTTPIYFIPLENYLVFEDNGYYQLNIGFKIFPKNSNAQKMYICQETKTGLPLQQWQANNYELAKKQGELLIDKCFENFRTDHWENLAAFLERQREDEL